jgi:hypothetical protein
MADDTTVTLDLGSLYHDTDQRTDNDDDDHDDYAVNMVPDAGSTTRRSWSHDPPPSEEEDNHHHHHHHHRSDWKIIITTTRSKDDDDGAPGTFLLQQLDDDEEAVTDQKTKEDQPQQKQREENETVVHNMTTTYYVHKSVLGAGPRKSHYFCRLFQSSSSSSLLVESTTSTSHIELQQSSAVAAFPILLDFMYNTTNVRLFQEASTNATSTSTAVALRYLANYFEVPALFQSTNLFIQKDMNKDNIHMYLQEAILYHDETIMEATMKVGAKAWQGLLLGVAVVDQQEHDNNDNYDNDTKCPTFLQLLSPRSRQLRFTKLVAQEANLLLQKSKQRELNLVRRLEMLGIPPV